MKTLLLILILCVTASAQTLKRDDFLKPQPLNIWKPYKGPMSVASTAVCVGGTVADIQSSQGLIERNPLARNSSGFISNPKAIALGFGTCGVTYLLEKKHPKLAVALRFGFGIAHFAAAIHNWNIKR